MLSFSASDEAHDVLVTVTIKYIKQLLNTSNLTAG
jgi:hypothetical protein